MIGAANIAAGNNVLMELRLGMFLSQRDGARHSGIAPTRTAESGLDMPLQFRRLKI
jgi:hypothetical protein